MGRISIGAQDREWVLNKLASVAREARAVDPDAHVYAVRATVFAETVHPRQVTKALLDGVLSDDGWRWVNISE